MKTKDELRKNFSYVNKCETLEACGEGQIMFSNTYVEWLEGEWLKVNGDKTSADEALSLAVVSGSSFKLIERLLQKHLKEAGKLTRLELDEQSEHELGLEIGRIKLALEEFRHCR